jgi:hypothetical protein
VAGLHMKEGAPGGVAFAILPSAPWTDCRLH